MKREKLAVVFGLSLCLSLGAVGCAGSKPKAKSNLQQNVKAFHQHMRWERYHEASNYLAEGDREAFLGRHDELGDDFRIVEYEIKHLRLVRADEEAEAEVVMSWIREPDMRVHRDKVHEIWRNLDGIWTLVEREVRRK